MFWDLEVTPEDEDEMIIQVANKIHQHGMEDIATVVIESIKPLNYLGNQMGRIFISPFLYLFGRNTAVTGEKFFQVFEKRENADKLITLLEKMSSGEYEKVEKSMGETGEEVKPEKGQEEPEKKGWRRFIPF